MMHTAKLTVEGVPELRHAVEQEMSSDILRSRTTVNDEKGKTTIYIEAEDSTALRAAVSSALRYVAAAVSAIEILSEKKEE